ncbi:MAG: HIT family protein [Clostridia bacterium]|nr:HIT family protein [Clostridia bacterium]
MSSCFYCEQGEKLRSLMIEVASTPAATIYLNRDQKHPGRCIVALNSHKTEYFQMSDSERNAFFEAVARTAEAIDKVFHPNKINYATFGDLVPHVHVHLVPKYEGGLQWGSPFDDSVEKKLLTESEYAGMIDKLRNALVL